LIDGAFGENVGRWLTSTITRASTACGTRSASVESIESDWSPQRKQGLRAIPLLALRASILAKRLRGRLEFPDTLS